MSEKSTALKAVQAKSMRERISHEEWEMRCELAAAYQLAARFKWTDLIFTHYRDDRHQDHRLVSDTTWQAFRDTTILEYEIPKYDGDLGSPNVFVEVDPATCERKIRYLTRCYATQRAKPWFTEETLRAIMRLRAIESRAPRYAEAFYGRKLVF